MDITKLPNYRFSSTDRKVIYKKVLKRVKLAEKSIDEKDYFKIIQDLKASYNEVQIRHLIHSFKTEASFYTDSNIIKFSTFFIAIGTFAYSSFNFLSDETPTSLIFFLVSLGIIILIIKRGVLPTSGRLNTVIFLLEEAEKYEDNLEN